jgi:hypothetical protein
MQIRTELSNSGWKTVCWSSSASLRGVARDVTWGFAKRDPRESHGVNLQCWSKALFGADWTEFFQFAEDAEVRDCKIRRISHCQHHLYGSGLKALQRRKSRDSRRQRQKNQKNMCFFWERLYLFVSFF